MRLPALKQGREQAPEMAVDSLERGQQAQAALAIEAADGTAQARDCLPQFVALGDCRQARAVEFRQFLFGDEVDRADPLALGGPAIKGALFYIGVVQGGGVEPDPFGQ